MVTTEKNTTEKNHREQEAKTILDTSAEKNRNLLFGFLLYLVTATVLVLSITDMELLHDDKTVHLPLFGVDLPLLAFAIVLPLLLLSLHFNLLHNMQEHRLKLLNWHAIARYEYAPTSRLAGRLFPFIADVAILRYELNPVNELTLGNRLVAAVVWLLYVFFPLFVLVLFLARFSDWQSVWLTPYHFMLFWLDGYLITVLWRQALSRTDVTNSPSGTSWWRWARWLVSRRLILVLLCLLLLGLPGVVALWLIGHDVMPYQQVIPIVLAIVMIVLVRVLIGFVGLDASTEGYPEIIEAGWKDKYEYTIIWQLVVCMILVSYMSAVLVLWGGIQGLHYKRLKQYSWPITTIRDPAAVGYATVFQELLLPRISVPNSDTYTVKEDDIRLALWADEAEHYDKCSRAPAQPSAGKDCAYQPDKMKLWNKSARPLVLRGQRLAFANLVVPEKPSTLL